VKDRKRRAQIDAPSDGGATSEPIFQSYQDARHAVLEAFERRYVTALLVAARGNVSLAARLGQMDRTYLIKLIRRHGLSVR